jgi:hypothetical protein
VTDAFVALMAEGYGFADLSIVLGAPQLEGKPAAPTPVRLPLAMMNRHGLVAGATGTGKTRTLQLLADQLSAAGVPVFCADMKGDLSGLSRAGTPNPKAEARAQAAGIPYSPTGNPVEFLSLTGGSGQQLRATVSSFGPLLLARVLGLNDTQQSVLALVFKYCDDKGLLLLDLADLRAVLTWLTGDGAADLKDYGGIAKQSAGVLLRKLVELEQQGADRFFGEPEFEVEDLLRTDAAGRGVVSILELTDMQDKPALFSTFMMWLLASLWRELPEVGDADRPKLVFFFDEAHLLFDGASKAFRDQIEQVVRLIRSKGVGIFFVTQTPKDVPADVLAQLGNRIQHALRAFTPDDEKALNATARTFPKSKHYDIPATLTSLGTGEALITVLSPRGTPTPVAATLLVPPTSQMAPITPEELQAAVRSSPLHARYAEAVDRESAHEMLRERAGAGRRGGEAEGRTRGDPSVFDAATRVLNSRTGQTVVRELTRGLMGVLGLGRRRR